MCGIAGIANLNNNINVFQSALEQSLAAIRHRGPDGQGTYADSNLLMGMRRLSIIDVSTGNQPIYNEEGNLAVVFNGEIYNYLELMTELKAKGHTFQTHSDTEVLVHLFEEYGVRMVERLRGMFAFAIHNKTDGSLFIARDRFGKKPLYYSQTGAGNLIFASELKALRPLARACGHHWQIREQSVYDYLSFGFVPQPNTIYQGVFALPAAHWMIFQDGKLTLEHYWDLKYEPKLKIGYEEAQEQVRQLVAESVKLRLRSDVPLGVFLSGGVDSSIVAYEAAREVGSELQTFTVAMNASEFDESKVAQRTAQTLGIKNSVLTLHIDPLECLNTLVREYDQPFADSSAIPSLEISKMAREQVTVVLTGDGGDEVFAGYRRHVAALMANEFNFLPESLRRSLADSMGRFLGRRRSALGFIARFTRGIASSTTERYIAWTTDMLQEEDKQEVWKGSPFPPSERIIENLSNPYLTPLDDQLSIDRQLILVSDLLIKTDIATMHHSLEARSPFMDHVLADFVSRLPDNFKVRGRLPKAILRHAYTGLLPAEVTGGAKKGFEIPLVGWLENELKSLLMDHLNDPNARVYQYLERDFVQKIIQGKALKNRNWGYIVYSLLILELWLRQEEMCD